MPPAQKFYITTPIYYVNDRPHIGHVYTTTIADILARHHRLRGDDVFFLTGTDEHSAKVVEAAAERGLAPQPWADHNAQQFQDTFRRLGITNNDFVRTSQQRHKQRVVRYVQQLMDSGDVYLGQYEGWYDAGQEEYLPETKAKEYGYKSPINGKPLVRKKEKNYFFRLSQYQDRLLQLMQGPPACPPPTRAAAGSAAASLGFVEPEARRNEVIARVQEGLNDVPISRTGAGDWGIKIPGDDQHTIYVWIDALFNYLSIVDTDDRRRYWPADVHLIAKDILWFHAVIWPALLMALQKRPGNEWMELPTTVYAHSFWISEGQKMSKSLGNFIDLEKIDHYVGTFGLDAFRYFLASNGPLGTTDSDFSEAKFIEVYNSDLANTIGNCFSRVTNMIQRYFGGKLPPADRDAQSEPRAAAATTAKRVEQALPMLLVGEACKAAIAYVQHVDSYIEKTQPFKLAKDPAKLPQVGGILYHCAEALRIASLLLWPIMPGKAEEVWRRLGCGEYAAALANHGRGNYEHWQQWGLLQPGTPILTGEPLFPRHEAK
jgi:methionyl-tRNA synthetase